MKTSELKKIVEDNGFLFRKTNNLNVYIDDEDGNLFSIQNLETIYVERQRVVHTKTAKNVMRALLEYTETPLEEREEEKKYYLKMPKGFNDNNLYVLKNHSSDNYFTKAYNFEDYKYAFTQKEIDAMPFDTSFFIKEEVK